MSKSYGMYAEFHEAARQLDEAQRIIEASSPRATRTALRKQMLGAGKNEHGFLASRCISDIIARFDDATSDAGGDTAEGRHEALMRAAQLRGLLGIVT